MVEEAAVDTAALMAAAAQAAIQRAQAVLPPVPTSPGAASSVNTVNTGPLSPAMLTQGRTSVGRQRPSRQRGFSGFFFCVCLF